MTGYGNFEKADIYKVILNADVHALVTINTRVRLFSLITSIF